MTRRPKEGFFGVLLSNDEAFRGRVSYCLPLCIEPKRVLLCAHRVLGKTDSGLMSALTHLSPPPSGGTAPPQPDTTTAAAARRMRGLLQKRSADGSWKRQLFSLHKHKLYYQDLNALHASRSPPRASLDLLDVIKTERVGNKLYLWLDEKRKHQLREAHDADEFVGLCPSLDEWEQAILERIAIARQRRRKRDVKPSPLMPTGEGGSSSDTAADKTSEQRGAAVFQGGGVLEDKHELAEDEVKDDDRHFYRNQIIEFYRRHNPEKVNDVDALILKYAEIGINEKDLLTAIQNK